MLIARSHPQVFVAEDLSDSVNVRPAHPQPGSCRMAQIMKVKVCNLQIVADSLKCPGHIVSTN